MLMLIQTVYLLWCLLLPSPAAVSGRTMGKLPVGATASLVLATYHGHLTLHSSQQQQQQQQQ
jgi:hypothetical protein